MATDIAVHKIGNSVNGHGAPAPEWPRLDGEKALAENTDSKQFDVAYPAIFALTATAKVRVDLRLAADAASLNPGQSPEVLEAGVTRFFTVPAGSWKLKTLAYV